MTLMLDFGRELGMPLRGLMMGKHFGWTTDVVKAKTMQGAGATVQFVPTMAKDADARKFDGWEVSFPVGSEVSHVDTGQE